MKKTAFKLHTKIYEIMHVYYQNIIFSFQIFHLKLKFILVYKPHYLLGKHEM